jgi:cyclophilin family peptidyl-prolyl cis-trans isomerase
MGKVKIISLLLVVLIFSGCGENNTEVTKTENQPASVGGDYISGKINSAEKAVPKKTTVKQSNEVKNNNMEEVQKYQFAEIETTLGKIKVKFYGADSPDTVANFLKLAKENFYTGTKFHRVIKGFMIQGGDPNSKTGNTATWGTGGPGYSFKDEFNAHKLVAGSLAMANSGPNTNGSQFFIVTAESTPWLDGKHTNFGEVVSGMDVVTKIENVKTAAGDRPVEDVAIKSITLLEK